MSLAIGAYLLIVCIVGFIIWLISTMNILLDGFVNNIFRDYIFVCNTVVYGNLYDEINLAGIIILEIIVTLFIWPVIFASAATLLVIIIARAIANLYKKIFAKKKREKNDDSV